MKHSIADHTALLLSQADELGLEIAPATAEALISYLNGVVEMNKSINLTRISTMNEGVRLHLLDSLLALPEIMAAQPGELLDLGTGGGFPGVPVALCTGRACIALDSVGKKANAVNEVLGSLGMQAVCTAVPQRAELHARENGGRYAVVTARALAPLSSLVELASPLLKYGGMLVAYKGAPEAGEFESGDAVAAMAGMRRESVRELVLPRGGERRAIVCYSRVGSPRIKLPRREGLAQHSPLG